MADIHHYTIRGLQNKIYTLEIELKLKPDKPEFLYQLGMAYKSLFEFQKAESYFLRLLEVDPDGPYGKCAKVELEVNKNMVEEERKTMSSPIGRLQRRFFRFLMYSNFGKIVFVLGWVFLGFLLMLLLVKR